MGFLNGRVTYVRYRVGGDGPLPFGEEFLEKVESHAIGKHGMGDAADGITFGWSAGDHVLDLNFGADKNILNDALHLAIRVDTDKIPGDLLRAYIRIETDARAHLNPTGFANKAQKLEAKEAARARAEAEAADGRFRRRKHYPLLWDGTSNILYAGTNSASILDRLQNLFRETFDRPLEPISAGSLAAEGSNQDFSPVAFLGNDPLAITQVAWAESDPTRPDYLGNEFLLWLWHALQNDGDTIALFDGSEATVMFAKILMLDCPRGMTGSDSLKDEGPSKLPEAFRAIQSGKLPRKAGLVIVRQGIQYDLTLQAESLAVSGLALPKVEGASGLEAQIARIDSLRHLVETLDLLYDSFRRRRSGPEWAGDLGRIRLWLQAA